MQRIERPGINQAQSGGRSRGFTNIMPILVVTTTVLFGIITAVLILK